MPGSARALLRALARTPHKAPEPTDEVAKAVAQVLYPEAPEPLSGIDLLVELERVQAEALAELERKREAEREAALPVTARLRNAIGGDSRNHMPLNGPGILRAALAGDGTIDGRNE